MLTILNIIARNTPISEPNAEEPLCQKDDFKIVSFWPFLMMCILLRETI